MGHEEEEAGVGWGEGGLGDRLDGAEFVNIEGVHGSGPGPIGGDEGAGEGLDGDGEGEDGAGKRQLEADEIDGK